MLCSNCGFENPKDHRYCGYCGTPFPYRSLTVPTAQSTLSFTSATVEVAAPVASAVAGAPPPATESEPITEASSQVTEPLQVEPPPAEEPAGSVLSPVAPPTEPVEEVPSTSLQAPAHAEPESPPITEPEPARFTEAFTSPDAVERAEFRAEVTEASVPEPEQSPPVEEMLSTVPQAPAPAEPEPAPMTEPEPARFTEAFTSPDVVERAEFPAEVTEASVPEAEPEPEPEPPPPPAPQPEQPRIPMREPERLPEPPPAEPPPEEPEIREPEAEVEVPVKAAAPPSAPEIVPERIPLPVRPPAPRVVVMPERRIPPARPARSVPPPPAAAHPSPDSLRITPPPASAGMPTFQEVADAAGAPPVSPFEELAAKPAGEDEDLKQFVANFRYMPPSEAANELTMRSEAPVIDKVAPAEFHHPSFDEDVPPPPEAGPHPTGKEYYAADGTASRPRFLDVGVEPQKPAINEPVHSATSILGVDTTTPVIPPPEVAPVSRRRPRLWVAVLALVAVFSGLAYLEGRAQSTHGFRGPVEFVRDEYPAVRDQLAKSIDFVRTEYQSLRERLTKKPEPAPTTTAESEPQPVPAQKQETPEQPPASQPETTTQPAGQQPDTASQTTPPADNSPEATQPQQQTAPATSQPNNGENATSTESATTGSSKRLEAPLPKPSSRPQPGQAELTKALQASDASAAAAWLWKATSRGNPEAPVRLADMYIKGNGVPRSCEQALVLLRSSAAKENAPARNRLAALYANGTCVARDRVKAYQLLGMALAADPNSDWAKESRETLWSQMTPPERTMAQKYR